ncbi:cytochrome P450 [Artomyces pyxidatus]|uniref:Cytochrome P450 n=1 Tax=Artomyces pyxidatus TaxID=48021 RepID=A0ACB8TKV7_9AGAM|nr:cytochrome P450 [Artomyces pyxidatus]
MPTFYDFVIVVLSLGLFKFVGDLISARRQNNPPIPPGPTRYPFVGSFLSIPTSTPWKTYVRWSQEHNSDLVAVRAFGQVSIIVNTKKAAKELFERRSAVYADRPQMMMADLMGWGVATTLSPYSDQWRAQRKILHHSLNATASATYHPMHLAKVELVLRSLYLDPEAYLGHIRHYAASMAMLIAYGYDVDPKEDRLVDVAEKAVNMISNAMFPGAMAVNAVPMRSSSHLCILSPPRLILSTLDVVRHLPDWFPGTGFKQYAKQCMALTTEMWEAPFAFAKRSIAEGTAPPSLASAHIEMNDARGGGAHGEKMIKYALGTLFSAAADTTVSAITTGILGLTVYPAVLLRAQAELDRVVGRRRLPTFKDRPSLPYITALCREILRWQVILPLALAHCPTKDDVYEGMFIPKGSPVLLNAWAILHDPEDYPDPEAFKPERFLTADGTLNDDEVQAAFGLGRRNCVGMHMGNDSVWITMASIISIFNISKAKDEHGNEIPVEAVSTDEAVSHPVPFQCSIRPRDSEAEELLQQLGRDTM